MSSAYRFGLFELQPDQCRLLVDGRAVEIGNRAFDVLRVLVERAGQLVSKRELLDLAWPDVVVEENNLQVQISTLRKLLGPQVIVTIPGRGYRLAVLAEDSQTPGEESASAAKAESAAIPDVSSEPSALYGRTDDLTSLRETIRHHALVTVVGPAGIGKTRLAQAVVDEFRKELTGGARLVELASLADPALVVVTVGRALGLVVDQASSALDVTVRALAGQSILLVLDNCEHVLEAVDHLVAALRKGAVDVHILATSQELLRHPDERVYRLGPLALPSQPTVASANGSGAVELFVARAHAVEPRFRLSDENVHAVVEICSRLDGIPLAIELAAARVSHLGVHGVRERLDERFRLLTVGSRLALRRHQTLRAALEWSHSLLSEPEQAVFEKLGVFAGSFSLESCQTLAADDQMDEWSVLDHLGALVDKSLVTVDSGATARYRMLETTRAFALECLAARGATSKLMLRHAEVMLALFERFYHDMLRGTPPAKGAQRLAPDLDNLRSALRWASEAGDEPRIAIALLGAVGSGQGYFHYLVSKSETWQWCESLRPFVDESIPATLAARFWLACAEQGSWRSPVTAIEDAKRAMTLYRGLDDRLGTYLACNQLVYSLGLNGRLDEARSAVDEALALRDPAWSPWVRGTIDNIAGIVFLNTGSLSKAREHLIEYLATSRQTGSPVDEWTAQSILIDIDVAAGNKDRAVAQTREMLKRHFASNERLHDGRSLRVLATALMNSDLLDEAEPVYREALSLVRRNFGTAGIVLYDAATLLARRGRIDDAARVFAYAENFCATRGFRPRSVALGLRDRLLTLLSEERSASTLSRLQDDGRRLTDDEACALAFPPLESKG